MFLVMSLTVLMAMSNVNITDSMKKARLDRHGKYKDIDDLAYTIYSEARGEGIEGMEAVASVIANRATGRGLSHISVVRQTGQFAGYEPTTPETAFEDREPADKEAWLKAQEIAVAMETGTFKPSHNYTFFNRPDVGSQKYSDMYLESAVIGNHKFGNIAGEWGIPKLAY